MNVTKSTTFHGIRLRYETLPVFETSRACSWNQRPSVATRGGFLIDNSTGVSAVECRHRP